jgi:hypothetical protein
MASWNWVDAGRALMELIEPMKVDGVQVFSRRTD